MGLPDSLAQLGLLGRNDLDLGDAAWRFTLHGQPAALTVAQALLALHEPEPLRNILRGVYKPVAVACTALGAADLDSTQRLQLARQIAGRSDSSPLVDLIKEHFQAAEVRRELALTVARYGGDSRTRCRDLVGLSGAPLAVALGCQDRFISQWAARRTPDTGSELAARARALGVALAAKDVRQPNLASPALLAEELKLWGIDLQPRDQCRRYAAGIRLAAAIDRDEGVPWAWSTLRDALHDACRTGEACLFMMDPSGDEARQVAAALALPPPLQRLIEQAAALPLEQHRLPRYEWALSTAFTLLGRLDQEPDMLEKLTPALELLGSVRPPDLRLGITRTFTDAVHTAGAHAVSQFIAADAFPRPHMKMFAAVLARLYAPDGAEPARPLSRVLAHTKLKDAGRRQGVIRDLLAVVDGGALPLGERRRLIELAACAEGTAQQRLDQFVQTLRRLALVERMIALQRLEGEPTRQTLARIHSLPDLDAKLAQMARRATPGAPDHRESADPRLAANWERFMAHPRRPEALMVYAQAMTWGAQEARSGSDSDSDAESDDRPASEARLIQVIDRFADAVVWADDPRAAFARLRYDTQESEHLDAIARAAPAAWKAWCSGLPPRPVATAAGDRSGEVNPIRYLHERIVRFRHVPARTYPNVELFLQGALDMAAARGRAEPGGPEHLLLQVVDPTTESQQRVQSLETLVRGLPPDNQFTRDLLDLRARLRGSLPAANDLQVVDTDDAHDLLLCGTEVAGSCQNVDGEYKHNRALMGYVVDGKYRMVAARHGEDGPLAARRMLRLLCDEQGRPALVLEGLYANAGIESGDSVDRSLVALAQQKAQTMGCQLLGHDADLSVDPARPRTVQSLGSAAPFEYVDSLGGVEEGCYEQRAWPVVTSAEVQGP